MIGDFVRDKDAVQACLLIEEAAVIGGIEFYHKSTHNNNKYIVANYGGSHAFSPYRDSFKRKILKLHGNEIQT